MLILLFLIPAFAFSQEKPNLYDTDLLPKEFHKGRRDALRALMPDSTMAVFFAAPVRNMSNDVDYEYHQDPDFYYLTGITEPNSMLFLFKNTVTIGNLSANEILFIQDRNPFMERWTGKRMGIEGAKQKLGLEVGYNSSEFPDMKFDFKVAKKIFYFPLPTDVTDDEWDKGDLFSLISNFKIKSEASGVPLDTKKIKQWMEELREAKQPEEIALLRKACSISCLGHAELMKALEPGMTEYQAESILEYMFHKNGSEEVGYPSIVGGGENSCVLHYETNRRKLEKGDMMVIDAAAAYHGYSADVTRSLPVSGKFSPEQKIIYNIVLEAQKAGIAACKTGNDFRDPHKAAWDVVTKKLKELGIIKINGEAMKYFFHGTSHYIGLDVHDAGTYGKLKPGDVITVEPGIYIAEGSDCDKKWWNIGVRIEDDILITAGEPDDLSGCVPKTVEEIEELMKKESIFNLMKD